MTDVILIVEDQPSHAKLFSEMLRGVGRSAVVALRGREGIAISRALRPALIIVDIVLPDLDGREVIAELRGHEATEATPILVVSAVADSRMQEDCAAMGASRFLAKPVRLHHFHEVVADLLSDQQPRIQ